MPIPSSLAHLFVTDKGWPLHPSASAVITVCQNNSHLGRQAQGGTSAPQTPEPQQLCPAEEGDNEKLRESQWVTAASLVGALEGEDAPRGGLLHPTVLTSCSRLWSLPGSSSNQADENAHASHSPVPQKLKPKTAIHASLCVEGVAVSCLRDQDTRMLLRLASQGKAGRSLASHHRSAHPESAGLSQAPEE